MKQGLQTNVAYLAQECALKVGDSYIVVRRDWPNLDLKGVACVGHTFTVTEVRESRGNDVIAVAKCAECNRAACNVKRTCVIKIKSIDISQEQLLQEPAPIGKASMFNTNVTETKAGFVGQVKYNQSIVWESEPFPKETEAEDVNGDTVQPANNKALAAADAARNKAVENLFKDV